MKTFRALMVMAMLTAAAPPAPVQSDGFYQKAAPLLHTFVELKAYGDNRTEAAIEDAFTEMGRINDKLNNYDPASEVSAINASAGSAAVPVSPETYSALAEAKKFAGLSSGCFDFTVGPLISLWDFDHDQPGLTRAEPGNDQIAKALRLVDYRALELEKGPGGASARLKRTGMRIDTGAFGKGFVADRAISLLRERGITSALVAAGGTICAIGTKPGGQPWQVGIRHPRKDSTFLTVITLHDQSVSTSGDYEKFYYRAGKRRTHIIDPRSGLPVPGVQSVTVIAPSGIASDALSTALFVLGPVVGLKLVEQQPGVEALLVTADGEISYSSGWPQKNIAY